MDPKDELLKALKLASDHFEEDSRSATSEGRWLVAYESRLSHLIWRTTALAIRQGFLGYRLNLGAGAINLARLIRAEVIGVADTLEPSRDETSQFRKAEIVTDLLTSLLDGIRAIESWTGMDVQESPFIALRAYELGRAEVALSLAERGHWEQMAAWSATQVGRPKGYREPWRVEVAPHLQQWIDADPDAPFKTLMTQMEVWLEEYAKGRRGFTPPDQDSLRQALRAMHKQGLIKHPRWTPPA